MSRPLAIDLFCGLGGWTEGLLAEGYSVVGFDNERHQYGDDKYPAQLVLQDVLTLHGSQFKDAALIVASPPCQAYSYRAMPWSRAKALPPPDNTLFDACFRIQREACEAAGRHIPLIVENVRGAQKWVGRSRWNYGSFHLWGDVPALMPMTKRGGTKGTKPYPDRGWTQGCAITLGLENYNGQKVPGFRFDGSGKSFQTASVETSGVKNSGEGSWFGEYTGLKQGGDWFNASQPSISRRCSSKSKARKAASAKIAKIPYPLARYIAATFKPDQQTL